jgi:hypothetical protein
VRLKEGPKRKRQKIARQLRSLRKETAYRDISTRVFCRPAAPARIDLWTWILSSNQRRGRGSSTIPKPLAFQHPSLVRFQHICSWACSNHLFLALSYCLSSRPQRRMSPNRLRLPPRNQNAQANKAERPVSDGSIIRVEAASCILNRDLNAKTVLFQLPRLLIRPSLMRPETSPTRYKNGDNQVAPPSLKHPTASALFESY